jgi:hypothetical protein
MMSGDDELQKFESLLNQMTGADDPLDRQAGHEYFVLKDKLRDREERIKELEAQLAQARQDLQDVPDDDPREMYAWAVRRWHDCEEKWRESQRWLGKCMKERGRMEAALQNEKRIVYVNVTEWP